MAIDHTSPDHGDAAKPGADGINHDLRKNMIEDTKLYTNLGQEIHAITRDKLELALRKNLPKYVDTSALLGQAGIFLALLLALLTTETKSVFGIGAEAWWAILFLLTIGSGIWAIRSLCRYCVRIKIDGIVDAIIKNSKDVADQ